MCIRDRAYSNQPPGPASAPLTAPAGVNAGPTGGQGGGAATSSRRESTVNFELDKTIRHVKEPLGRIKRLSVAVVVNYRNVAGEGGQAEARPLSPEELTKVNGLVREAVGYNQDRGDTVNVVNAAFTEVKSEEVSMPVWKDPQTMAMAKELLKNLLVFGLAFYLVFGVLRPLLRDLMRPVEAVTPEGGKLELGGEAGSLAEAGPPPDRSRAAFDDTLREAKEFAKQNPKLTADIIKQWMAQE